MGTFEFNGEKYRQASRHQKEWGNKLMSELRLRGDEAILDLGCGDGALTERLALLAPDGSVLGVDASAGMIQTAQKHERDNLRFLQMDINQMEFEDEFDVIYSNAALHWVKDHERLLRNTCRALRSGGTVVWNFAGDGTCSNFFGVIRGIMEKDCFRESFEGFEWPWFMPSRAEYETLVQGAAFSEAVVTEENEDRYFADTEEMTGWLDQPTLVPFLGCVAEEKKEAFRTEAVNEMIKKTVQPDGKCFETFRRIKVYARK